MFVMVQRINNKCSENLLTMPSVFGLVNQDVTGFFSTGMKNVMFFSSKILLGENNVYFLHYLEFFVPMVYKQPSMIHQQRLTHI